MREFLPGDKVLVLLPNSEILRDLPAHLSHLSELECSDLVELIESNKELFDDVPTQTHLLKHNIDGSDSKPIKQHPYFANPDKCRHLKRQVDYLVQHGITGASCTTWSSLCFSVLCA